MHYLIAAIYFLFSLLGWDGWGVHTIATRAFEQGTEVLYSETSITPVIARFVCVDSASGRCHYRLFSHECTQPAPTASTTGCVPAAVRDFELARGDSTELADMSDTFEFCVSQHALPSNGLCKPRLQADAVAQSR